MYHISIKQQRRNSKILKKRALGLSINKLGMIFGVSKQRIFQIIQLDEKEKKTLKRLQKKYK